MNRPSNLFSLATCALGTALLMTACGGGDAEAPPSAINQPTTAPVPDTTPPTLAVFSDASTAVASGPVTFSFVFSEDVGSSFAASDIVVTGGTAGTLTKVSATQYTLVVTPPANASGTIGVAVAAGTFSDGAGNINTAAPAAVQVAFQTTATTQMALPVSFDSTSVAYGLVGFGGAEDSSIAADPTGGTNKVAKVVRAAGSETYAGTTITAGTTPATQLGFAPKIPFNANDTRMSVRVWSPDAGIPVRLKVEDHADPTHSVETETTVTTAAGWQTLTFDFAPGAQAGGTAPINFAYNYDKATIFFDFGRAKSAAVQKTYYFDDVAFVAGTGGGSGGGGGGATCGTTAPTCAPTTTIPAGAVTIYSDAAQVTGFNPHPDWGQAPPVTYSEMTIAANKSLQYGFGAGALYEGLDWAANPVDVSTKGKLHLDFWSADITSVKVSIISAGKENAVTQAVTAGSWNSVDIDLASYTVPDKSAIIQIKLEPNTAGTLYVDNVYFWGAAAGGGGSGFAGTYAEDYTGTGDIVGAKSAQGGDIGFFFDPRLFSTKSYDYAGVANSVTAPGSVYNFYYGLGLDAPAITDAYFGAYVKAPGNATVNVASYTNLKLNVWGPDQLFQAGSFPALTVVMQGPAAAGCSSNSGGSEVQATFNTTTQGAASIYTLPLSSFTLTAGCGGDTTVAQVLAHIAQVNVLLLNTNIQYVTKDPNGVAFTNGLNIGTIKFN